MREARGSPVLQAASPAATLMLFDRYRYSWVVFCGSSKAPWLIVLLKRVRPTYWGGSVPGISGLFRYLTPTKPAPAKNGGPKMAGSNVQPVAGVNVCS